jgi:hypothetical protein
MLQQCGTLAATAFDAVKALILAANPDAKRDFSRPSVAATHQEI